jgi:glutaredoxin-like protein
MFSENELDNIKRGMEKLKNKVSLKIFTDYKTKEENKKVRTCMACEGTFSLLQTLAEHSNGKLVIEELSTEEDIEESKTYNVERVPTILFLDEKGTEVIRYTATPTGPELAPFIETLQYFSGVNSFYRDTIQANLKKMSKSDIKLFMTLSCPYCPSVIPVLNLFAILSKGKIKSEIIDINLNPDIAMKYNIQGVPHAMINEKEHISGMFSPQDLLDKLTKGQRDFGGMYA